MRIAIAADHGGYALKEQIKNVLKEMNLEFHDYGTHNEESVDYPDYGVQVAESVAKGEFDRGILVCGTGIGMSIVANKVPGVRCALVHDCFTAKATREHKRCQRAGDGCAGNRTGSGGRDCSHLADDRFFRRTA